MTTINQLSAVDTLSAADLVPIYSSTNGDARKASMAVLAAFIQSLLNEAAGGFETQYSAPAATGFSVTVDPSVDGGSVYLLLTPLAGYAAGTIVLPAIADCADGQEVLVSCTQAVTTLTVSGNGATAVNGAPTALAANGFFRLRYNGVLLSWYRIG
jgi:hypothetical protein